jgi:cytochrome P450
MRAAGTKTLWRRYFTDHLGEATMTITIDRSSCPSVFDAGLPEIDYEHCQSPDEAHTIIRQARQQAPIAMGPHGPELLTYELVHAALRDSRFRVPQGMFLAAQGITSGPLWDRVSKLIISVDGEEHRRLRRLVSKAFTPRATARLRTTVVYVITELVDRRRAVRRGHRYRPEVPHPDHLRAPRGAGRGLEIVLPLDRRHLQGL